MTRIVLHIGITSLGTPRLQALMDEKRGALEKAGVMLAGLGRQNHTKLYMAVTEPGHVDPLRAARGFGPKAAQAKLLQRVTQQIITDVKTHEGHTYVLTCHQLSTLPNASEIKRLQAVLSKASGEIEVVAHVDAPARMLLAHYSEQILDGRREGLERDIALADADRWRSAALKHWGKIDPATHHFPEVQAPPHWIDLAGFFDLWAGVFGAGNIRLRPLDPEGFTSEQATDEITEMLGIDANIGKATPAPMPALPSAETLARARELNFVFERLLRKGRIIPKQLWNKFMSEIAMPGPPIDPGALHTVTDALTPKLTSLIDRFPDLADRLAPPAPTAPYEEAQTTQGYRATQYAAAALPRIDKFTAQVRRKREEAAKARANGGLPEDIKLTPVAEKLFSPRAKENYHNLSTGRFAPHNKIGRVNEEEIAAAFIEEPLRDLPKGNTGRVIVGCMKNEAPYIVEWIAYHRMIGVDNFLIYTNDCTDGTAEILDRLQEMGVVQHRDNTQWKGNSPQQSALNKSLKEPLIQTAEWVIHIDVDEFMNIRCGNGRLDDFLEVVPDATNVAMTWRLFGHNGVTELKDDLVIDQFDDAAPKYCPKPHTAWGFKTMTKNIGAYGKLSCHRPNKLDEEHREAVQWVNGSGQVMTEKYKDNGWRSDLKTIGYDLLQLNHYALRSAESFLIKRQRGRALHVDRSIGINYWVRMDWGGNRDVTIKRNVPRVRAEMARLFEDAELKRLHDEGFAWHRNKVTELHNTPEFKELFAQALETKLTEMERVAFALTLDMES